jgi:putative ABC transport system permease protein
VVGMVICYQVLSSDVADHLAEYATLKAIGYPNRYLGMVVLQEALLLAVAGFVPGLACSWLLYQLLSALTDLPMELTWFRIGFVLFLTIVMCAASGLLALRKALEVDPAEVF